MRASVHVYHEEAARIEALVCAQDPERLIVPIERAQVLFANSVPPELLARAQHLRLIQTMGAGVEDLLACRPPDHLAIASAKGVFAAEAAEHAVAMMLALARGLPATFGAQERQEWRPFAVGSLAGTTVGVVGLGEIGRRIAKLCDALEMQVIGVRRTPCATPFVSQVHAPDERRSALARCDWVVLALPLTNGTRGFLDRKTIAALRRTACVIQLGRGGVVDEPALFEALSEARIGGAAIDVFEEEPLPASSVWWRAPNTIVTPHVAGFGRRYLERAVDRLLENMRRFDAGEPLLGGVDRAQGY